MHYRLIASLVLFTLAAVSSGQGTATDGAVSYRFKINPFLPSDNGDLFLAAGTDHLFETWWYIRLADDSFETRLRDPDTQSYSGNVATLGWSDADLSGRIDAQLIVTITELSEGQGAVLQEELKVTNTSGGSLTVNLFAYSDLDLTKSDREDSAEVIASPTRIHVFDAQTNAQFEGEMAELFQVTDTRGAFPGLRGIFADDVADDLLNTGLPFGPADWEGAFQWRDVNLAPGDSFSTIKVTTVVEPIFVDDFQVNTFTTGVQRLPSVALHADGDFVVVWTSQGSGGTDSSEDSIQGQRYAADGSAVGGEFQINTYTTNTQAYPSVALDADGDFVVVWEGEGSSGTDSSSYSVQGQRFAADGSTVGGQFQVNTYTSSRQGYPSVARDADGGFVVVWQSLGSPGTDSSSLSIQGQRYAADGSAVGGQFQVNTYITNNQAFASVALDADGDFVVVWEGPDIQGQRFAADGSTVGGQFRVNTYIVDSRRPSVSLDADGDFVVVWHSYGLPGRFFSIEGQRYAADGSTVGSQFEVNSVIPIDQRRPSVAVDPDGNFVVVWDSSSVAGPDSVNLSIQGRRFAADGSAVGGQFQVNTYTTSDQVGPSVALNADGDFVVVWSSGGSGGTDTDSVSVQGHRFTDPLLAGLIVPGFEVAVAGGVTTFFAVRNTTDNDVEIDVAYHGEVATRTPLRTDIFMLGPQETLTRDVGSNLAGLNVSDGFATGLIVITESGGTVAPNLEGDYFRLDPDNDFAAGDRLARPEDFCTQQEIRFVDFGSGSQLRVLLDTPRGAETASFTYTAYDETGTMIEQGDFFTSDHLNVVDIGDLVTGGNFGTVFFDFTRSAGGFVTAEYSAFGRYSVELNAACRLPFPAGLVTLGTSRPLPDAPSETGTLPPGAPTGDGQLTDVAGLILPGFEVEVAIPDGPTTFFAVRNTGSNDVTANILYYGVALTDEPLRTDIFVLGPQQTLTWNIRFDLTDLSVVEGFATGLVVITEDGGTTAPNLEGDYFRLDPGNDFATGDRLVRPESLCSQQEIRFVDFGSGSQLRVLLDTPRGVDTASFTYTAYDESGAMIGQGEFFTSDHLNVLDIGDLVTAESFGTVFFDFTSSAGGFATAKYSAVGRYSVELNAACRAP